MTPDDSKLFRRLHDLTVRHLESTLTDEEHEELQSLLMENPTARRLYVEYQQETACLRWLCLEEIAAPLDAHSEINSLQVDRPKRMRRWVMPAIAAAIACSILLAALANLISREAARASVERAAKEAHLRAAEVSASGQQVATVTALDAARWKAGLEELPLLSRCFIGQRWQLAAGRAELTFDAGALVTIFGPADFDIISPTSIRCRRGRVTALVDERGRGFTVETPRARVVDLGTQFGLDISDDGATEVVVFQGSVDLSSVDGGKVQRMVQGDALVLTNSGEMQRLVAFQRDSYLAGAGRGLPGAPLIANVRDNIRKNDSTKSYQIVHRGLGEDVLCFVDRDHQWNGIEANGMPEFLVGADYIMPFNDDKFVRELELTIELTRPAMLYVFLDNNMEIPDWIQDEFEDTGFDLGLDGATTEWHPANSLGSGAGESVDFIFSVWRRAVREPGIFKLGGLTPPQVGVRSLGFNMYGIAAIDLERAEPATNP